MIFPDVNYICLIYSRAARDACFSRYIALFLQLSASRYFTKNTPNHFQRLRQILPKILIPSPQTIHPAPKHPLMPRTVQIPAVPRYIPTCPLQNSRSPAFARSSTRHISPSLQIAFIGYPSLISASRQIKTPFIKYTINTLHRTVNPIRRLPAPPVLHPRYPFALHNLPPKFSSDHPPESCSTKTSLPIFPTKTDPNPVFFLNATSGTNPLIHSPVSPCNTHSPSPPFFPQTHPRPSVSTSRLHPRSPHHIRKPACHHTYSPAFSSPPSTPGFSLQSNSLHPPPIPIMRPNLNQSTPHLSTHHAPSKKHLINHINPILLIQKRPLHFNDPYFISHTTFHFLYTMHPHTLSRRSAPGGSRPTAFSSTQPDLTEFAPVVWWARGGTVPILSHSSALFFSPAAPQMRSRSSRPSYLSPPRSAN